MERETMNLTMETETDLINQSDRNVFEFWNEEIVALYVTGGIIRIGG
jgi:hypothetical protein